MIASPADRLADCVARLDGDRLIVANARVERSWRVASDGRLHAEQFINKAAARDWFAGESKSPSLIPPGPASSPSTASSSSAMPSLAVAVDHSSPVSTPSLLATLTVGELTYRFRVFPDCPSVTMQLVMPASAASDDDRKREAATSAEPSGIEASPSQPPSGGGDAANVIDSFTLRSGHLRITQVTLHDQTDVHGNLAFEKTYYLEPAERFIKLAGNLFFVEDVIDGSGIVFLKHAPLPDARPVKCEVDLEVRDTKAFTFFGHGTSDGGAGYEFGTIAYTGGRAGRIAAIQQYQRQYRPYVSGRDGLFQSNTWGDRSRDARVTEGFILAEIEAGQQLGVDIVQVDDGWQTGKTSNWADNAGGVWNDYWATNKNFWQPNPQRFPNGLKPVVDAAGLAGLKFGLWYSPDSSNDFANWDADANTMLTFHLDLAINHFKIDGVKATTKAGERNLIRMFDKVLQESAGQVSFDLDVTAEIRPGYFGAIHVGPIFVQNRYTDWRKYWPHHTLRTLWTLAHYIDPVRLRLEFLNNARNADKYGNDPLQPANYRPDFLFATVMFASPLGWFEVSNLPQSFQNEAGPLIAKWKEHRDAIFNAPILPVGDVPDGVSFSGFVSASATSTHVLLFRGLTQSESYTFTLPEQVSAKHRRVTRHAGEGSLSFTGNSVTVTDVAPLRFGWFELRGE